MPYQYLDDIATADVAFLATGTSLEELFSAAGDALMNVMVADLAAILRRDTVTVDLEETDLDLLLFSFLQELIYYKDARQLLLRTSRIAITEVDGTHLRAILSGERIDPLRHKLDVDVKAVTLYRFRVEKVGEGWEAQVILDI
jgi:SHS2 domain-containing protein